MVIGLFYLKWSWPGFCLTRVLLSALICHLNNPVLVFIKSFVKSHFSVQFFLLKKLKEFYCYLINIYCLSLFEMSRQWFSFQYPIMSFYCASPLVVMFLPRQCLVKAKWLFFLLGLGNYSAPLPHLREDWRKYTIHRELPRKEINFKLF